MKIDVAGVDMCRYGFDAFIRWLKYKLNILRKESMADDSDQVRLQ